MKLSMRRNLVQQQGEFKMKYSGYFLLPLMIFSRAIMPLLGF